MIRKAGTILLTSLLILSTVGFVVSRHYCNNILVSVAVDTAADRCDDGMNADCCHDEDEYIVLKTDFVQPAVEQLNISVVDILDFELVSLLKEPSAKSTNSKPVFLAFLKPEQHKSLALIQSYLL